MERIYPAASESPPITPTLQKSLSLRECHVIDTTIQKSSKEILQQPHEDSSPALSKTKAKKESRRPAIALDEFLKNSQDKKEPSRLSQDSVQSKVSDASSDISVDRKILNKTSLKTDSLASKIFSSIKLVFTTLLALPALVVNLIPILTGYGARAIETSLKSQAQNTHSTAMLTFAKYSLVFLHLLTSALCSLVACLLALPVKIAGGSDLMQFIMNKAAFHGRNLSDIDPNYHLEELSKIFGKENVNAAKFETKDGQGKIDYRFLPTFQTPPQGTMFLFCTNSQALEDSDTDMIKKYATEGFNVVLHSRRGYGGSVGTPSGDHSISDGLELIELIKKTPPAPLGAKTILHGHSMGGMEARAVCEKALNEGILEKNTTYLILDRTGPSIESSMEHLVAYPPTKGMTTFFVKAMTVGLFTEKAPYDFQNKGLEKDKLLDSEHITTLRDKKDNMFSPRVSPLIKSLVKQSHDISFDHGGGSYHAMPMHGSDWIFCSDLKKVSRETSKYFEIVNSLPLHLRKIGLAPEALKIELSRLSEATKQAFIPNYEELTELISDQKTWETILKEEKYFCAPLDSTFKKMGIIKATTPLSEETAQYINLKMKLKGETEVILSSIEEMQEFLSENVYSEMNEVKNLLSQPNIVDKIKREIKFYTRDNKDELYQA